MYKKTDNFNIGRKKCFIYIIAYIFILNSVRTTAFAANNNIDVVGRVYEFDKDSNYEFTASENFSEADSDNTYGNLSIAGNILNTSLKDGVPSYEVDTGNLAFFYTYGDSLLNAGEEEWHLIDDKSKKIDSMIIDEQIMKGTIILQTSKDRNTWIDVDCITNAFSDTPIRTSSFYSTTDVQLVNGCFYRIIVVYKVRIKTDPKKLLFIALDNYEYKKCAEIYEFYASINSTNADEVELSQTYSIGSKTRTEKFEGYSGKAGIDKKDHHYGWDIGNFFLSGYTDKVTDADGNVVFLKNLGDKVTLWFLLKQNINAIQGNNDLTVTADTGGYDQYFETPKMNFGRGALIIRYTDYNNVSAEPIIYTNYLEANATVDANSKVQLFEEGDYEVALDYEVTNDKLIDKVSHYRIFFKFSVRNSNCMVYPFDLATGSELTNSSMTKNGFRLDLAKSRYLKINVKREVLKDSADGLIEDARFNGSAQDGARYTDEGIYTITVSNKYTNQFTVKKIYVGTNNVLRAQMTTGLTISEINDLVADGATISDDGIITMTTIALPSELPVERTDEESFIDNLSDEEIQMPEENNSTITSIIIVSCAIVVICIVFYTVYIKKQNRKMQNPPKDNEEVTKQ